MSTPTNFVRGIIANDFDRLQRHIELNVTANYISKIDYARRITVWQQRLLDLREDLERGRDISEGVKGVVEEMEKRTAPHADIAAP